MLRELKGKAAVFAVELKGITMSELPELNDDFAQDVSEFDTFDEYKAKEVEKLQKRKKRKLNRKKKTPLSSRLSLIQRWMFPMLCMRTE